MFMYPIAKDVPLPADWDQAVNPRRRYPFAGMQPGESVFIQGARTDGIEYSAARMTARRKGWRFTARNEKDGVRIWRVK